MPSIRQRRLLAASVIAVVPCATVLTAVPAQADTMSFHKSSGRVATVEWQDHESTDEGFTSTYGSLHVEDLGKGEANVFGFISESTCSVVEEDEWVCESTEFDVMGDSVAFTLDSKLSSASLEGTLQAFDWWTGEVDTLSVDVTWTAVGDTFREAQSYRYRDGSTTVSNRMRFAGRQAQVTGTVGEVDLGESDWVWGQLGSYRVMDRFRTK